MVRTWRVGQTCGATWRPVHLCLFIHAASLPTNRPVSIGGADGDRHACSASTNVAEAPRCDGTGGGD